jgi:D-alanyl-D-alanine carboxypeptidase
VITPQNIYAMGDAVQAPDVTPPPAPTTTKPR